LKPKNTGGNKWHTHTQIIKGKRNKVSTQNNKRGKHTNLEHTRENKTTQRFGNRFCFGLHVKTCKGTYLVISTQDRVGTTGDIGEIWYKWEKSKETHNWESKIWGDYWVRNGVGNYPTNDMVGKETKKTKSERGKTTKQETCVKW
jgi:hypothetical protein